MKLNKIKDSFVAFFSSNTYIPWALLFAVILLFVLILYPNLFVPKHAYQVGDVADRDVKATKEFFPDRAAVAGLVNKMGRENGVVFNTSTWYGDIIWLLVSLTMTDQELGVVINAVDKATAAVEKQFL